VKSIFIIIVAGVLFYLALCAVMYGRQRAMLYFLTPESRLPGADILWLEHDDQRIKVWKLATQKDQAIIYFGGNAEDVAINGTDFIRLFPDYDLYLMNYRGYGGSSGSPSEEALFSDARALYDTIKDEYDYIAVIGRSLGTGVAVHLGAERPVARLALITPFDSMAKVAAAHYPWLPAEQLLKDRYESAARGPDLDMPTLVIVAEHDEVIPRRRTDALIETLDMDNLEVVVLGGAGHNNLGTYREYEEALRRFFAPQANLAE
jgi:pimeloyl-ACP methyl ester carboxylesterase